MTPKQIPAEWLSQVIYNLFITVVAVIALLVMAAFYLLPLPQPVREVLYIVDLINALILLADFFIRWARSPNKLRYVLPWGWLSFLGSLPGFPLLRLFRLGTIFKTWRETRHTTPDELLAEARQQLAQSTLLITSLVVLLVVTLGSIAIVLLEAPAPQANIHTGYDAVWWALVTIATVGYGDLYPVTNAGRVVGVLMIVVGVSLFSVLTSYIASTFLRDRELHDELALLRHEVALLRQQSEQDAPDAER